MNWFDFIISWKNYVSIDLYFCFRIQIKFFTQIVSGYFQNLSV